MEDGGQRRAKGTRSEQGSRTAGGGGGQGQANSGEWRQRGGEGAAGRPQEEAARRELGRLRERCGWTAGVGVPGGGRRQRHGARAAGRRSRHTELGELGLGRRGGNCHWYYMGLPP